VITLFDASEQNYLHYTMRDYQREVPLSLGAIGNAIPRLVELGYVHGSLYPKERGESWRLYLADLRPGAKEVAPKEPPVARFEHVVDRYRIIMIVEDIGEETPP
jgi:hypothetical protein